jgi:hypothetical protein
VNTSFRPAAGGDAFAYIGTLTQTTVRPPLAFPPTPSPNPTSSQTLTSTVSQSVTVSSGATFNGVSNAFDFKTSESDVLQGGLKSSSVTSDTYYAYEPSGAQTKVVELGSTSTTSDGVSYQTLNGAGNGLVDILPESAGILLTTSTSSAAATTTETDPDGQVSTRTTNADGAYSESIAYPDGTSALAVANADGSGTYSFPYGTSQFANATFAVSAPTAVPSIGPAIAITITFPQAVAPATSPTPFVESGDVGIWYPTPVALTTQTLVDEGSGAVAPACAVASAFNGAADLLVMTNTAVDPVFGEIDQLTTQTYTEEGIGVACVQLNDAIEQFYDFSGQSGSPQVSDVPLQTTTTIETLGLSSETVLGTNAVARSPQARGAFFAAGVANFRAYLARKRAARHAAFARELAARRFR